MQAALGLARVYAEMQPHCAELERNPLFVLPRGRGVAAVDVLTKPAVPEAAGGRGA